MRCTGRSKQSGEQCKKDAMVGRSVCHIHGGKTPRGVALPQFKHGRYSEYLPARLSDRYQEALADPELLALREEIALTDARIADLLLRVDTGESGALWLKAGELLATYQSALERDKLTEAMLAMQDLASILGEGAADYAAWNEVGKAISQRQRLVESERRRLGEMQQMITVERLMALMAAVVDVFKESVEKNCVDATVGRRILADASAGVGALLS